MSHIRHVSGIGGQNIRNRNGSGPFRRDDPQWPRYARRPPLRPANWLGELRMKTTPAVAGPQPARAGPAGKPASVILSIRCRSGTGCGGPRRHSAGRPPAPDSAFRPTGIATGPPSRGAASIAGHPQSPTMSPAAGRPARTDRITRPVGPGRGPERAPAGPRAIGLGPAPARPSSPGRRRRKPTAPGLQSDPH